MNVLEDIHKFTQISNKIGNIYQSINYISKRARKYRDDTSCLESQALTYVVTGRAPIQNRNHTSTDISKTEEVLSLVSNEDVIQSVLKSVNLSTAENIQYVYLDSLNEFEMSRVRVLVNKILMR